MVRQCLLLGLPRSSYYYAGAAEESEENLSLMRQIDELFLRRPFFGSPRMTLWLQDQGWVVNEKRVARLMRVMGLQAVVPGPHTSRPHPGHKIYPYLLRGMKITVPDQVWCTDITYLPMRHGYLYLVVVMDWFSRYVLAWELSNSLEVAFCLTALDRALGGVEVPPGIFNSDQGSQFSCEAFTGRLTAKGVKISMDGRGRALDNVFVERLWRSLKYEEVYIRDYADGAEAERGLGSYFQFYNRERRHQSLEWRTPEAVYLDRPKVAPRPAPLSPQGGGREGRSRVTTGGSGPPTQVVTRAPLALVGAREEDNRVTTRRGNKGGWTTTRH